MALSTTDLRFETDLPDLPTTVPVAKLARVDLDERRPALETFAERLSLRETRRLETPHGMALATGQGHVEYFRASGGVLAMTASDPADDELRRWDDLEEERGEDGSTTFTLGRRAAGEVIDQVGEVLEAARLREDHQLRPTVELEQVTQLDEEGTVLQAGAGRATVRIGYEFEGLPVLGAGAKTRVTVEPAGRRGLRVTGALHVWRRPTETVDVELGTIKDVLAAGLLDDVELQRYHEAGSDIVITHLEVGYLALPAMDQQATLLPTVDVQGRVSLPDDRLEYFEFARHHRAASPQRFRDQGIFDHRVVA
ncbi:hypothetical protein [Salsipaludibacter albus]|uniref:hypothetical protein n=1 Tax=Salsipaludibacter albus TaxID=2849650 RepID=UPI001EE4E13C|nr:hypothetical protein [Salsipaludibacter albus]MBY5162049.1 hypothetical protein [Salsipaludibacter albus]